MRQSTWGTARYRSRSPLILAVVVLGACGGEIAESAGSALTDAGSTKEPQPLDAAMPDANRYDDAGTFTGGGNFDLDAGFEPPISGGPTDQDCASRPELDCDPSAESHLADLAAQCSAKRLACGHVSVAFNGDGCAAAMEMDDPSSSFVDCMAPMLDAYRWSCISHESGEAVSTFLDCPGH